MKSCSLPTVAALWAAASPLCAASATWHGGFGFTPDWWTIGNNWPAGFLAPASEVVFPAGAAFIGAVQKVNTTMNPVSVNAPGSEFDDDRTGLPHFFYVLEYSGNLLTWTAGDTRQADASGDFLLSWTPPPDKPFRRFFRVRAL